MVLETVVFQGLPHDGYVWLIGSATFGWRCRSKDPRTPSLRPPDIDRHTAVETDGGPLLLKPAFDPSITALLIALVRPPGRVRNRPRNDQSPSPGRPYDAYDCSQAS